MENIDDSDVPDSGAVFTFGKSRFADNVPGKFWIRDDPILQIACGDEHTALLTASGRVFTFGSNEWGQLGHGHKNCLSKPSCVKALKQERAILLACGRSHTLVATDIGNIYGFGTNADGQLGSPREYSCHAAPVRIQGLEDLTIKMLSGGADHSIALTDKGAVYVWGSNSEGQIGLDICDYSPPVELKFESSVICVSAGYYHSAFVTVDGKLYTCGETECGKLGHPETTSKKVMIPRQVPGITSKIVWVSCGGNHTVALTADGRAYSFGNGFNGQLGLTNRILEAYSAHQISYLENVKIARVSCGENHTAFLADTGQLYTCGDRRHGKLGLLEDSSEISCGQFVPVLVTRFQNFQVQQVACGGCHMLVLAVKRKSPVKSPSTLCFEDGDIVCTLRGKRSDKKLPPLTHHSPPHQNKQKEEPVSPLKTLSRTRLPSINKSPVWYVPLEKVADETKSSDKNLDDDDDDEILSKLEQRCSILSEIEDEDIRHVDSDVDSDNSEVSDLNKTHTLVRVNNTVSIVRPIIASGPELTDNNSSESPLDQNICFQSIENVPSVDSKQRFSSSANSEFFVRRDADAEDMNILNECEKKGTSLGTTDSGKNEASRKSQFYDADNKEISCAPIRSTKTSKACILL